MELSLNGQNFSEDRALFTYYGHLTPETVSFRPAPPQEGEEELKVVVRPRGLGFQYV